MRNCKKLVLSLLFIVLLALMIPVAAFAASCGEVCRAGEALRTNPVYVSPRVSSSLSSSDVSRLAQQIQDLDVPVFLAILSENAADEAGGLDDLPHELAIAYGGDNARGVFAIVSGRHIRAGASPGVGFDSGEAQQLAGAAVDSYNPAQVGLYPMLSDFVSRVANHRLNSRVITNSSPNGSSGDTSPDTKSVLTVIGVIFAVAVVLFIIGAIVVAVNSGRRRKREAAEEAEKFEKRRAKLQSRHDALSTKVMGLDSRSKLNPSATQAYNAAMDYYNQAEGMLLSVTTDGELDVVTGQLEAAELCFSDAEAYLEGRDPVAERAEAEEQRRREEAAERQRRAEEAERRRAEEEERQRRYEAMEARSDRSDEHDTYWRGGNRNGVYYGPGWYPNDFLTTYLLINALNDDGYEIHEHHHYEPAETSSHSHHDGDFGFGGGGIDFGGSGDWGGGGSGDFGGGGGGGGSGDW